MAELAASRGRRVTGRRGGCARGWVERLARGWRGLLGKHLRACLGLSGSFRRTESRSCAGRTVQALRRSRKEEHRLARGRWMYHIYPRGGSLHGVPQAQDADKFQPRHHSGEPPLPAGLRGLRGIAQAASAGVLGWD